MDMQRARETVRFLADGIDPMTGEVLGDESVFNSPNVIRALYTLLEATAPLTTADDKRNAGKPWTEIEDDKLRDEFDAKLRLSDIAAEHGRTKNAIESRLEYLGLKKHSFWFRRNKKL